MNETLTVYQCQSCPEGEACGFDGETYDQSYDECHHPMDLGFAQRLADCFNTCAGTPTDRLDQLGSTLRCAEKIRNTLPEAPPTTEQIEEYLRLVWGVDVVVSIR
jgi:hypothetical protein